MRHRKVLADLIGWVMNQFIIPMIRYNFYVTEKHGESSKIFYYRKPLWKLASKLAIYKLQQDNLQEVAKSEFQQIQLKLEFPFGKLRILPKKNTFRPIMTF